MSAFGVCYVYAKRKLMTVRRFRSHNDFPWQMYKRFNNAIEDFDFAKDLRDVQPAFNTDIPRLKEGLLGAQVGGKHD